MRQRFDLTGQPRISVQDARQMQQEGTALLVDVRPESEYRKEHLAGAVSMPLRRLRTHASELPKDRMIITYCA